MVQKRRLLQVCHAVDFQVLSLLVRRSQAGLVARYSLEDLLRAKPRWPELIKLGRDLPELLAAAVKADSFDEVFLRSEWLNREHLQLKFKGRDCGTGLATLLELLSRCTKLREVELDLSGTTLRSRGQVPLPSCSCHSFEA